MELSGFSKGFMSAFQSFGFVFKHRFVHFYFYSFFISLALLIVFLWLGWESASWLAELTMAKAKNVLAYFNISSEENSYSLVLTFIFNFILRFLGIYLVLKFSKYILLVLLSPLFAYVSEVAEQKRTGKKYPIGFLRILKDAMRGVFIALRNMVLEVSWIFLLFVLTLLFPPLALFTAILSFVIGAYFYGFSMMDYCYERWGLSISQSVIYTRKNAGFAIGLGVAYSLWMMVPVVGWIFASVNTAVGAAIALENPKQKF